MNKMCVHYPLILKDGKLERLHIEYSEEERKELIRRYKELEENFTKRFPDIKFEDHILWWDQLIECKTDEEVNEILEFEKEEEQNSKSSQNKKTIEA